MGNNTDKYPDDLFLLPTTMTYTDPKSYKQDVPEFGHKMLKYYAMDPKYINLNNGSYGTTPRPVQLSIDAMTAKIESCPDLFHKILYQPLLVNVRERLASLIKVKPNEVALVENASMGINTVLRNFEWEEGDIIISFSSTYDAVKQTIQHISDVLPHPTSSVMDLVFPNTHEEIVKQFETHLKNNPASPNKKRVVVIDSIVSIPGALLPWQEMVKICKDEGAWSVIDAAHSIGQEVGLNLTESAPDFWVSNCHKWLSAKRSCAVLYVPERNQHILKSALPTADTYIKPTKPGKQPGFADQFYSGTVDWTRYLTIPDALEFRQWMGGEEKINAYCHDLAIKGGQLLAKSFGTRVLDPDGDLTLNMVNIELPLPGDITTELMVKMRTSIRYRMLVDKKAFATILHHNGKWWIRCSTQVWNELEDFEKIGGLWLEVCKEIKEEFGLTEGP